jgi:hypothetical protein
MNKSEEARHEINCLDATPCLFTSLFSFSKHLTSLSNEATFYPVNKKSTGDGTNA